jgi:ribosomal protein S18 acetylase RimI-like enzyme
MASLMPTPDSEFTTVPCSQYSFVELAEIYNETRTDYIVPMPMNAKRLEQYVRWYDVDLERSMVIYDSTKERAGLGMLALRGDRAWITRLGVLPERRGKGLGLFIMESLLAHARAAGCRRVQLEVIKDNDPAHNLFLRLGFRDVRELLVIRRPPGRKTSPIPDYQAEELPPQAVQAALRALDQSGHTWLDEPTSMRHLPGLRGQRVICPAGEGLLLWQHSPLQMEHLFLVPVQGELHRLAPYLLHALHSGNPAQDTKLENLPADDPTWPVYQQMGYIESFRRIEMYLHL